LEAQMAKAIPDGYRTVTAALTVKDGSAAIEFYQKAFGAREIMRVNGPDGKIMHAEIQVGDSRVMLADESPQMGCVAPVSVGRTTSSLVEDPSGHRWGLATHMEDPAPEEMARRQKEFFASMASQK
jgi:PhnB protein